MPASSGDGTAWDTTIPTDSSLVSDLPLEIREVKNATEIRLEKEHNPLGGSSAGGEHKQGSAVAYYENASFPTDRPNGTSDLDAADKGRLLVRYDSGQLWYFDGADWQYVKATVADAVTDGILTKEKVASGFTKGILPMAVLEERQTAGTDGGTLTSGSWETRDLNTEVVDVGGIVTLASSQFTLGNGTYRIRAISSAYEVNLHRARIYNITDAAALAYGTAASAVSTAAVMTTSEIVHEFTISGGDTVFELQHRCQTTKASTGRGVASNFGVSEIFARVEIYKLL